MKRSRLIGITITSCALLFMTIIALTPATSSGMAKKGGKSIPFDETAGWQKIDLGLKSAWEESSSAGEYNKNLECILKTTERVSPEIKRDLEKAGFKPRTTIGTIVTGGVSVKNLPAVANLEIIKAMELSVPMSLKKRK